MPLTKSKTKVVIIQKAQPSMWYNGLVKKRFKVTTNNNLNYYELPDPKTKKIIFKEDCIVID